jgi:hypothetical protein
MSRCWQWNCLVDATAPLRQHGIDPYIEAAAGNPTAVIAETATVIDAELVVLGNGHGRRWQATLKRSPFEPTSSASSAAMPTSSGVSDPLCRHDQ